MLLKSKFFLIGDIMGMFDTIQIGEISVQVKCYDNNLDVYNLGDKVPKLGNSKNYTICLPNYEEVRFAIIIDCKVWKLTDREEETINNYFTKWGASTTLEELNDRSILF